MQQAAGQGTPPPLRARELFTFFEAGRGTAWWQLKGRTWTFFAALRHLSFSKSLIIYLFILFIIIIFVFFGAGSSVLGPGTWPDA